LNVVEMTEIGLPPVSEEEKLVPLPEATIDLPVTVTAYEEADRGSLHDSAETKRDYEDAHKLYPHVEADDKYTHVGTAVYEEYATADEHSLLANVPDENLVQPVQEEKLEAWTRENVESTLTTGVLTEYDVSPRDALFDGTTEKAITVDVSPVVGKAESPDRGAILTSYRSLEEEDRLVDTTALPSLMEPVVEAESKYPTETSAPDEYMVEAVMTPAEQPDSAVLEKPMIAGTVDVAEQQHDVFEVVLGTSLSTSGYEIQTRDTSQDDEEVPHHVSVQEPISHVQEVELFPHTDVDESSFAVSVPPVELDVSDDGLPVAHVTEESLELHVPQQDYESLARDLLHDSGETKPAVAEESERADEQLEAIATTPALESGETSLNVVEMTEIGLPPVSEEKSGASTRGYD